MKKNQNFEKIYNETINMPFVKDMLDKLPENEKKLVLEGLEKYVELLSVNFVPGMTKVFNYDINENSNQQISGKIIKDE